MKLWSDAFKDGAAIPERYAFCAMDRTAQVRLSDNLNPHLAWSDVPNGTESFVLMVYDCDAPSERSAVNQRGKTIAAGAARQPFFHWIMVDMAASRRSIAEGEFSSGVTARGKQLGHSLDGQSALAQGLNDYTGWFADDAEMAGQYFGYDGPCPPWNDMLVHHYIFRLYALDAPMLELGKVFDSVQLKQAMFGHILDEAQIIASYTLNAQLAA